MGRVTDRREWEEGKQEKAEDRNDDKYRAGFETQQGWWLGVCSAQPHGRAIGSSPHTSVLQKLGGGGGRTRLCLCKMWVSQSGNKDQALRCRSSHMEELAAPSWSWSPPAQTPDSDYAGPKPGIWWRLWEPWPLLTGAFPPAHEAWGPGTGHAGWRNAQPSQPQARFGRPAGLALAGSIDASVPVTPQSNFWLPLWLRAEWEGNISAQLEGSSTLKESIAAQSHCPVPWPSPDLIFSATQFPPDRFSTPISHSSSRFLSSSANPCAPWLLLLQPAKKHNLDRFLFPSLHFPIHHFPLPTFIQSPCPSPGIRISSWYIFMLYIHPLYWLLRIPCMSPTPPTFLPRFPAAQHLPAGWIPPGSHQPPGPDAVLKHSLQGQVNSRTHGKHLKRLQAHSYTYNKARLGAACAVVAKAHLWLQVLPCETPLLQTWVLALKTCGGQAEPLEENVTTLAI